MTDLTPSPSYDSSTPHPFTHALSLPPSLSLAQRPCSHNPRLIIVPGLKQPTRPEAYESYRTWKETGPVSSDAKWTNMFEYVGVMTACRLWHHAGSFIFVMIACWKKYFCWKHVNLKISGKKLVIFWVRTWGIMAFGSIQRVVLIDKR